MPDKRLQKCRDAYMADGKTVTNYSGNGIRVTQPSAAYRITQAQLAAEQRMVSQALKDLQAYAGKTSREPV